MCLQEQKYFQQRFNVPTRGRTYIPTKLLDEWHTPALFMLYLQQFFKEVYAVEAWFIYHNPFTSEPAAKRQSCGVNTMSVALVYTWYQVHDVGHDMSSCPCAYCFCYPMNIMWWLRQDMTSCPPPRFFCSHSSKEIYCGRIDENEAVAWYSSTSLYWWNSSCVQMKLQLKTYHRCCLRSALRLTVAPVTTSFTSKRNTRIAPKSRIRS